MTLRGQGSRGPGGVPFGTGGFPPFLWPAGFDPTVVPGVPAPVGSIGMLVDGSAGWVKWYDGGDTGWVSFYDLGLMQFTFAPLLAQAGALGTLAGIQVALSDLASKQAALDAVAADQAAGWRMAKTINPQTGAAYQPTLADAYEGGRQLVTLANAAPIIVTLPAEGVVAFAAIYGVPCLNFQWKGAGKPTFVAGAGATLSPAATPSIAAAGQVVSAILVAPSTWILVGALGA